MTPTRVIYESLCSASIHYHRPDLQQVDEACSSDSTKALGIRSGFLADQFQAELPKRASLTAFLYCTFHLVPQTHLLKPPKCPPL
jgi:hypothetical protein